MNRREVTWRKRAHRVGGWAMTGSLLSMWLAGVIIDIGWAKALFYLVGSVVLIGLMMLIAWLFFVGYLED